MNQIFETTYVFYEISDGVLKAKYKPGTYIDVGIAKQIVEERNEVVKNKSMPVIIYDEGIMNITTEARNYLASKEANKHLKAGAIINKSAITSVLGNFFINMNKPSLPAKLFRTEEQAIKWLKDNFL